MLAPIVLFAYKRLSHLQRTISSLANNELAAESELFVFSDGPKTTADEKAVEAVREYLKSVIGFKMVRISESPINKGLANSIIDGVTTIVNQYGKIIVLEDNMESSPFFLRYMNEALTRFAGSEKIASIHAYSYSIGEEQPEYFLRRGADCWGWGTWADCWTLFNPDSVRLLRELQKRHLIREFDYQRAVPFSLMLREQATGKIDSWAIRWHASVFLAGKYSLQPGRSLIRNIGIDNTGMHCGAEPRFEVQLSQSPIVFNTEPLEESLKQKQQFASFFRQKKQPLRNRIRGKIKTMIKRVVSQSLYSSFSTIWNGWRRVTKATGDFPDMEMARNHALGYDQENIVRQVVAAQEKVMTGEAVFERDSCLFLHEELNYKLLNGLLLTAANFSGKLHVLDFGGSLGSVYYQNRKILERLPELSWNIVEQPHFVEIGKNKFTVKPVFFYEDIPSVYRAHAVNAALFSSVIQYLDDPWNELLQIIEYETPFIIIDRTPLREKRDTSRFSVQTVPPEIYQGSYAIRLIGDLELKSFMSEKYVLIDEFVSYDIRMKLTAPREIVQYHGQIWQRRR